MSFSSSDVTISDVLKQAQILKGELSKLGKQAKNVYIDSDSNVSRLERDKGDILCSAAAIIRNEIETISEPSDHYPNHKGVDLKSWI